MRFPQSTWALPCGSSFGQFQSLKSGWPEPWSSEQRWLWSGNVPTRVTLSGCENPQKCSSSEWVEHIGCTIPLHATRADLLTMLCVPHCHISQEFEG